MVKKLERLFDHVNFIGLELNCGSNWVDENVNFSF